MSKTGERECAASKTRAVFSGWTRRYETPTGPRRYETPPAPVAAGIFRVLLERPVSGRRRSAANETVVFGRWNRWLVEGSARPHNSKRIPGRFNMLRRPERLAVHQPRVGGGGGGGCR